MAPEMHAFLPENRLKMAKNALKVALFQQFWRGSGAQLHLHISKRAIPNSPVRKSPIPAFHSTHHSKDVPMATEAPAPLLTLDINRAGDVVTIKCHGKLVSGVTDVLYSAVCKNLNGAKHMVLDLGDLAYMDSLGLGTLARIYVSTKSAGCSLELMHLGKRVRELLSVTNMLSVFTVIGENSTMIRF